MPRPKSKVTKTKNTPGKMICQNPGCEKMGKEQTSTNFYNTNSTILPKYPVCKKCLQKIINIHDIQSVYKVLKEMDIAFMKEVWDTAIEKTPLNPFGKYITMMNSLPQNKGLKWNSSIFNITNNCEKNCDEMTYSDEWVGTYSEKDLKYLNDYLKALQNDFKIVTKNHIDYAKKIAKASLAMDKAYESMLNGGSEQKYKMMKEIFDSLSKSAQFAESERGINDISLGNFGVVFDKVEKKCWIPPQKPDELDIYDKLLEQFSNIEKSLR